MTKFSAHFSNGHFCSKLSNHFRFTHAWCIELTPLSDGSRRFTHGFCSSKDLAETNVTLFRKKVRRRARYNYIVNTEIVEVDH